MVPDLNNIDEINSSLIFNGTTHFGDNIYTKALSNAAKKP